MKTRSIILGFLVFMTPWIAYSMEQAEVDVDIVDTYTAEIKQDMESGETIFQSVERKLSLENINPGMLLFSVCKLKPDAVKELLTDFIETSAVEVHAELVEIAIACGMSEEEALLAAIEGGADPTLIAQATAAGPGSTGAPGAGTPTNIPGTPSSPGLGSGGGGGGSVSEN